MVLPRNENGRDSRTTPDRNTILDFTTSRHESNLQSLWLTDTSISEFSSKLKDYLSVLASGHSIALHQGERLASLRLEKSLESLFSTAVPRVIEGPSMTWMTLVLAVGPQFDGPSAVKIGESRVELPPDDLELVRSGRPWRFLSPWPDNEDCKKELRSIETTQQELIDTRRAINEVLEDIFLLEDRLRDRHQLVDNMYRDGARRMTNATWNDNKTPGGSRSNVVTADETGTSMRMDVASRLVPSVCPNSSTQIVSGCDTETVDAITRANADGRNCTHPYSLPVNASPISETRTSNFIRILSELLGDFRNHDAMRWSEDGHSFYLAPEEDFPTHLLTMLSTASYGSLVRRLYYFGFRKVGGAYRHDGFIRGQPSSVRPHRRELPSTSKPPSGSPRQGPRVKVIKKSRRRGHN